MRATEGLVSSLRTIASLLAIMGLVAVVEATVPLHARGSWHKVHVGPNLALTFITFGTSLVFNMTRVSILFALDASHVSLLRLGSLPPLATTALAVVLLDLSFYVAHRAMHWSPSFWRFHAIHHSDPAVDVTTTIRQHPGETVIRYGFMAAFAIAFGTSPEAFALYRVWSVVNGFLEHANVRVPRRLDTVLSGIVTTPNMHKVHHSRSIGETNTNYGNIVSTSTGSARPSHPPSAAIASSTGSTALTTWRSTRQAPCCGNPFADPVGRCRAGPCRSS